MSISNPRGKKLITEHQVPLIKITTDNQSEKVVNDNDSLETIEKFTEGVEDLPPSSEDRAGFLSSLLFTFVGVYWWKTRNATTDEELMERPSRRFTAHYAGKKLEKAWAINGTIKEHFLHGVWRAARLSVSVHAFTLCLEELTRVAQPLLLRSLMEHYDVPDISNFSYWTAMRVSLLISLLSFVTVFIHHPYFHGLLKVGNETRVGTGVMLYKKALRLALPSLSETNSGQLIQLLNTDAGKMETAFLFIHYVWLCPILAVFYGYILWTQFGMSCFIGFVFMMVIVFAQVYFSYQLGLNRKKLGDKMDARLKVMSEVINGIKVIKMHGWEEAFATKINALRENEIRSVAWSAFCSSMVMGIYFVTSKIGILVFICACLYFQEDLTTKSVFAVSALYNSVRLPFALFLPLGLLFGRELISTSRRISYFFRLHEYARQSDENEEYENCEVLQNSALPTPSWILDDSKTENAYIKLSNVTTVWFDTLELEEKKEIHEIEKNEKDHGEFEMHEELPPFNVIYAVRGISFEFTSGQCYGVIGQVGSGKSSLLLTILSEARFVCGDLDVRGSIAYCSQEPWIFTGTIRENIVFGGDFDRDRYEQALELCLLKTDMQQLTDGDLTMVGDNGSTLSGGQRARVALARAVYADADIYLLDDPLSAVDAQVGKILYEKLIREHLSNKIVILVTHQIHFLSTAHTIIVMKDQFSVGAGSLEDLKACFPEEFISLENSSPAEDVFMDDIYDNRRGSMLVPFPRDPENNETEKEGPVEIIATEAQPLVDNNELKQLDVVKTVVKKESRQQGTISFRTYWQYTKEVFRPFKFGTLLAICVLATQLLNNFVDWWQNKWLVALDNWRAKNITNQGVDRIVMFEMDFSINDNAYMKTFMITTVVIVILGVLRSVWFRRAQLSASRALHNKMFNCVLNTQSEFFDHNSEGTILNRFTKDIGLMDDMLAFTYFEFVFGALTFLGIIGLVLVVRPIVSVACIPITMGFYYCRKFYVTRSRELKRIEAAARSPLNTLITSTIHGLATIRAFRRESEMIDKFNSLHDVFMAAYNMASLSARWFGICIDFLVSVFVSIVAIVVVMQYEILTTGEVGLSLVCAVQLSGFFSWIMRQSAELENGMVSVERVLEYTKLESEEDVRKPHEKYLDEDYGSSWPEKGEIEFENLFVKYGETYVLKNITCVIHGGQKIGVVGRTGAGKSSMLRTLFGLKEYSSGRLLIDGVDLDHISLKFRRSGMSIIPQEPMLFSGTVRENLDPFNKYDDATLWAALEQCELKKAISKDRGLHVEMGQRGVSLSVGQRQLFCLARAMIHHSKILVIDEATANVDGVTDACIQRTIQKYFAESTIITVAHRLHTIMNTDRIMVFEKGALVEFDKPVALLNNPTSRLSKMAAQTGAENFEALRAAAISHDLENTSSASCSDQ